MRSGTCLVWVAMLALATAGCSKKQAASPSSSLPVAGEQAKAGAKLAYEHRVRVELEQAGIAARMAAVREACESARFGDCNVLQLSQDGYRGSLVVRIVPAGVEPLTALASRDGKLASRETWAEDLAGAVQDNARKLRQLDAYASQLDELSRRKDLSASDLVSLAHERATLETQRDDLLGVAAGQQRRLDTNRLSIDFIDPGRHTGRSFSIGHWSDRFREGVDDALSVLAYGIPFLLLAFPLTLGWRWLWRRVTRRSGGRQGG
ncbi:MAG: hypothetical protein BGP10_09660 [Rhodanobacter sp. 68-29]|nr:MAG: hypothetical protein ABT17_13945 [Rhodanobacter sp. SCN 69-32]OJY62051.1 MAG: hypothetical protein BGP10_09660 [Rhodanobacter sp. 68-29]